MWLATGTDADQDFVSQQTAGSIHVGWSGPFGRHLTARDCAEDRIVQHRPIQNLAGAWFVDEVGRFVEGYELAFQSPLDAFDDQGLPGYDVLQTGWGIAIENGPRMAGGGQSLQAQVATSRQSLFQIEFQELDRGSTIVLGI